MGEDRDIGGDIGEREEAGAGDGAAGPQMPVLGPSRMVAAPGATETME